MKDSTCIAETRNYIPGGPPSILSTLRPEIPPNSVYVIGAVSRVDHSGRCTQATLRSKIGSKVRPFPVFSVPVIKRRQNYRLSAMLVNTLANAVDKRLNVTHTGA